MQRENYAMTISKHKYVSSLAFCNLILIYLGADIFEKITGFTIHLFVISYSW